MKQEGVRETARVLQLLNSQKTNVLFHGYSMEPLLTEGDQVFIDSITIDQIQVGDIIVSSEADKYPARRVLFKKKDNLIVWRDNWGHREILEIYEKDILGQLVSRKRKNNIISKTDLKWKLFTFWAFLRLIPGRFIYHFPPLKNYIEKHHTKQGPIYD